MSAASNLFTYLPYGQYQNILLQYGVFGDGTIYQGSIVDTTNSLPSTIHETSLVTEANRVLSSHGIVDDYNTQVMIFPQQGSTYDSTFNGQCGHHNYGTDNYGNYLFYSVILYSSDWPCDWGGGSVAANMTKVASHEYAEEATDPTLDSWNTKDGYEIGDLCNLNAGATYYPVNWNGGVFLQEEWSNWDNACVFGHGQEYWSPASPNKRTVQNGILSKYQSMGATSSVLSYPVSQETVLGNGAVSYFVGPCNGNGPNGSCAAIYWSPSTGSQSIWGADYGEYLYQQGPNGPLGWLTTDPFTRDDGSISYTQHGGIYTGSGTGTHAIWGDSGYKYWTMGENRSPLGWLIGDPFSRDGGTITYTQHGGLYSSSLGTFADWGNDGYKYWTMGEEKSILGWLKSDPIYMNGGAVSYTQNGGIYDKSGVGTFAIWGNDGYKYWSIGGPGSALGWLKSDPIYRDGGAISYTQNGGVYDKSGVGTFAEWGNVGYKYWTMGEEASILGWPKIDNFSWGGGTIAYFQGGGIYSTSLGTFADWGNDDIEYENLGGPDGKLGWPVSDPIYLSGGAVSYFQGGNCGNPGPNGSNSAIYDSPAGTHEVNGCIYAQYLSYGGPTGILGYPISDEWVNSSGYPESDFTGGTIVWENGQAVVYTNTGCGFAKPSTSPAMSSAFPSNVLQPNC